MKVTNI